MLPLLQGAFGLYVILGCIYALLLWKEIVDVRRREDSIIGRFLVVICIWLLFYIWHTEDERWKK